MANKQALREFQSHLAGRLQAAKSNEEPPAAWLAVEAGNKNYLLPLNQSAEIFPWTPVQAVPYTQPWFMGVANLRGGLYGVLDLASFMTNQPSKPRTEATRAASRLVTLRADLEINSALLVDRLIGLRKTDEFHASADSAGHPASFMGKTYIDSDTQEWQEINIQSLVHESRFLAVGA